MWDDIGNCGPTKKKQMIGLGVTIQSINVVKHVYDMLHNYGEVNGAKFFKMLWHLPAL